VADSLGSKKSKPWGSYFTRTQLLVLMIATLAAAYAIGTYYIVLFVPLLAVIAALEGFFLFAYNFEAFGGRFHNNFWFAASWGSLPVLAGYVMQENSVNILALAVAGAAGLASYAEIRMSRPYKDLKRAGGDKARAKSLENGLKAISLGTIAFALSMLAYRVIFS
jgi:4-hydroxybenzoate polyprenyltransferase